MEELDGDRGRERVLIAAAVGPAGRQAERRVGCPSPAAADSRRPARTARLADLSPYRWSSSASRVRRPSAASVASTSSGAPVAVVTLPRALHGRDWTARVDGRHLELEHRPRVLGTALVLGSTLWRRRPSRDDPAVGAVRQLGDLDLDSDPRRSAGPDPGNERVVVVTEVHRSGVDPFCRAEQVGRLEGDPVQRRGTGVREGELDRRLVARGPPRARAWDPAARGRTTPTRQSRPATS